MAKEKLADKVISELQRDISLGKYKPGDLIPPEPLLMELFGVGRSTIREAIKTLSNAGILKVQQGQGTTVASLALAEPLDQRLRRAARMEVNHVRALLEIDIVQLAAANRDEHDLQTMQACLNERWQAIAEDKYEACADADIRFHKAVAQASHNSVLADLYHTFTTVIRESFQQREHPHVQQFKHTHQLHGELLLAITQQQSETAESTVRKILEVSAV